LRCAVAERFAWKNKKEDSLMDVTALTALLAGLFSTTFVITPDGKIERKITGGLNLADMEKEIERLMQ
jgi:hypothetical protein